MATETGTNAEETRTNAELVTRGFDALNDRDREAFRELHDDDAVVHAFGEEYRGIDAIVAEEFGIFAAFSDLTYTPEVVIAEGETVAARWTAAGTHDGEFDGIEPTGEDVEFPVMGTFRVENDRIAEVGIVADQLGLLQQLGVVDPPTG